MILDKALYQTPNQLISLFIGMKVRLLYFFKSVLGLRKSTARDYPQVKTFYSQRFRGVPYLTVKETGELRCNSCMLCVHYCPADCLHVATAEPASAHKEQTPSSFDLEILRCVFCGLCEEVCPVDAIRMSSEYSYSDYANANWLLGIDELAFRSSLNEGKGVVSTVDDNNPGVVQH